MLTQTQASKVKQLVRKKGIHGASKHRPGKEWDPLGSALCQIWELKLHLYILNIFCGNFNLKQFGTWLE